MKVECVREFKDLEAKTMRHVGEQWEVTAARLQAINGTKNGVLVKAIQEKPRTRKKAE